MSTSVVHPGVDPAAFPPQPERDWGWRLACVGRVEPVKGLAVAIEALTQLPPQATLTIQGDGDAGHRAALAELAAARGVRDRAAR